VFEVAPLKSVAIVGGTPAEKLLLTVPGRSSVMVCRSDW
jgi:hypothetical protein